MRMPACLALPCSAVLICHAVLFTAALCCAPLCFTKLACCVPAACLRACLLDSVTKPVLTWCLITSFCACPAAPAEVAEGAGSPTETKAQADGTSQSAADLSGAGSASELPQVHAQAAEAAPAKPAAQQSTEAERTAPPATAEASPSVSDSATSAAAGTSSPSAGMWQDL